MLDPSPVFVTPHVQTKHVRLDLVASTHCPRPEHEFVPLIHALAEVKQPEMDPIGCCGGGRPGASGVTWGAGSRRACE